VALYALLLACMHGMGRAAAGFEVRQAESDVELLKGIINGAGIMELRTRNDPGY